MRGGRSAVRKNLAAVGRRAQRGVAEVRAKPMEMAAPMTVQRLSGTVVYSGADGDVQSAIVSVAQ